MTTKHILPAEKLEEQQAFLSIVVEKVRAMAQHMDSQLNILLGADLAIFVYATSQYNTHRSVVFFTLALFAALSACISLIAIHPFKFMRKRGEVESIMYNRSVIRYPSHEGYREALAEVLNDSNEMLNQYSLEIYNVYKFYYRPKRDLYTLARNTLLVGVVVSFLGFAWGAILGSL